MKNWWLDLYTIPTLKVLGKAFAIIFSLTLALCLLIPPLAIIMFLGSLYIFHKLKGISKYQLQSNIEFHKTHVPFKELKSAVLKDYLIVSLFMAFSFLALFSLLIFYVGSETYFTLVLYGPLCLAGSFMPSSFFAKIEKAKKKSKKYDPKNNLYGVAILGVMFLVFYLSDLVDFNPMILAVCFLSGLMISAEMYRVRSLFHLEPAKLNSKIFMKYGGITTAISVCSLSVYLMSARPIIESASIDSSIRFLVFSGMGDYAPELEIENTKDFLALYKELDILDYEQIYRKSPQVGEVPFHDLLSKTDMDGIQAYLRYANPSPKNLEAVVLDFKKQKFSEEQRAYVAQKLATAWPRHVKMPDELREKKIVKKDIPEGRVPAKETQEDAE